MRHMRIVRVSGMRFCLLFTKNYHLCSVHHDKVVSHCDKLVSISETIVELGVEFVNWQNGSLGQILRVNHTRQSRR